MPQASIGHYCFIFALLLPSCQNGGNDNRSTLMDVIERSVTMPPNAMPIHAYARYYAKGSDGKIKVLYVIHDPNFVREARALCQKERVKEFPCRENESELALAKPGERKWLPDERDLPIPSGGGCAAVTFKYDEQRAIMSTPRCNGDY